LYRLFGSPWTARPSAGREFWPKQLEVLLGPFENV
jgi:hypothetical protein